MGSGKDGGAVGRPLRAVFDLGAVRDLGDGQLLERFASGRGEGAELAFAALVERHGPMVLRVARGVLADPHDADDAFQATFLVLVAKARGLWARDSLGPWLHQVAHRTASCLRKSAARRRRLDRGAAKGDAAEAVAADDLAPALHEEIDRLPERLRAPVVLCDLQGRTHAQAARALGWPVGTVKSRQARARDRLRARLARRGLAPGLAWPLLGPAPAATLIDSTTAAAVRFIASRAIAPGPAAALAREVICAMTIFHWGQAAPLLLALGAAGAGLIARDRPGAKPPSVAQALQPPAADSKIIEVRPGKLDHTLNERGVVESSPAHALVSEVDRTTTIIRILPDGAPVKEGDVVAELEAAPFRDQLANHRTTQQQAEAAYEQARLTREVAEFAVKEYTEGVAVQDLAELQGQVAGSEAGVARGKARLDRIRAAQKRLDEAIRRHAGAETPADVMAESAMADRLDEAEQDIQARTRDLDAARGRQKQFQQFTVARMTAQLRADVEKARRDEWAKRATWEQWKAGAAKLERQISKCTLRAPNDGIVVHANPAGPAPGNIEEGAIVHERQPIARVVDPAEPMRLIAKIPEPLVDQVRPGQRVRVKVDGLPDLVLGGVVRDVAPTVDVLPPGGGKDNKFYTTYVQLDEGGRGLRPGMGAAVEIPLFELLDVLSVPVGAVLRIEHKDHVLVRDGAGAIELREVILGKSNDRAVEVKQGLQPGDRVITDPPAAGPPAPWPQRVDPK